MGEINSHIFSFFWGLKVYSLMLVFHADQNDAVRVLHVLFDPSDFFILVLIGVSLHLVDEIFYLFLLPLLTLLVLHEVIFINLTFSV